VPWPQPLAASGSTRTSFTVLALPFHPCHANHPPPTSLGVPLSLCLTIVRFILRHHHPPISPSTVRAIAISPVHPPCTELPPTPTPTSPHSTSLTPALPGDRACVVAVRSFPLLVVLLRRRIHTPVRCLCSALCDFEPPRYPGTHPPSAPALRSLAACC
jgi:hypothetical protein